METLAQSKFFIALGGFLGFSLSFASGMLAGTDPSIVLRDASFGCLVGAILMKMLMHVIHSNVQAVMQEQHRERKREEAQALLEQEEFDEDADADKGEA